MNVHLCLDNIAPEPWLVSLRKALPDATVSVWTPDSLPADYALVWNPPQQFFDQQPNLKAVFNIGAGVDSLLELSLPEDLVLVRLEDSGMSVQMSEYICHAVSGYFRDFKHYDISQQQSKWSVRRPKDRSTFAVGIMGMGNLGTAAARALQMFGYTVNGYSKTPKQIQGVNCYSGSDGLKDFLNNTKVLVNLLPLTKETEYILNRDTLSQLQEDGYVINVARGRHLVDQDLIDLINSGHLAAATLDVFSVEPLPSSHAFWQHPKITVTPHIAARTNRDDVIAQISMKIRKLEQGEQITGIVDKQKGY